MNLLHLHYFYVVARERGFTNASRVLRVQQPAISRMVGQLEESLGFALFERVGRGIRLTRKGAQIFDACERIFNEVESLEASIGRISGECAGPLAFAAAEPIASCFVPVRLARFLDAHPKVVPSIFSGPASMMLERIANGELEFGLFFHIPDVPPTLESTTMRKVRFRLVVRSDSKRKSDVLSKFIGSREIDDRLTRRFPTVERLRKDHPKAAISISSNNLTAHREMVLQGLGVSILPEFLVADDIESGRLADVYPKEKFEFALKVVTRKRGTLSQEAKLFLDLCHD